MRQVERHGEPARVVVVAMAQQEVSLFEGMGVIEGALKEGQSGCLSKELGKRRLAPRRAKPQERHEVWTERRLRVRAGDSHVLVEPIKLIRDST
jgi:hypothetical protein